MERHELHDAVAEYINETDSDIHAESYGFKIQLFQSCVLGLSLATELVEEFGAVVIKAFEEGENEYAVWFGQLGKREVCETVTTVE